MVLNGRDVTGQVSFCKKLVVRGAGEVLCAIEDVVRFLHDDYFAVLNGTNFKEACTMRE